MWKRIVAFALTGWAGIIWLAWWMADKRIRLCGDSWDDGYRSCTIRATATRDFVLTTGLTVALGFIVIAAFVWWRGNERIGNWRSVNRSSEIDQQK